MKFQRSSSPVNTSNHTQPRREGGFTRRTSASTSASAGLVKPSRAAESHTRAICSRSSLRTSGGIVLGPIPAWPYTEGSRPVRALFCSSGDRPDRPRGGTEWSNPLRSRLGRPRMDPPSVASPHRNSRAVSRTASNDLESWRQVYALRALSGRYATHHVRITGLDQRLPRPPRRRR